MSCHRVWVDPLCSLGLSRFLAIPAAELLGEALHLALAGVPPDIDHREVRDFLGALPGVVDAHDLRIWPVGAADIALTCHLVMPNGVAQHLILQHRFLTYQELVRAPYLQHSTLTRNKIYALQHLMCDKVTPKLEHAASLYKQRRRSKQSGGEAESPAGDRSRPLPDAATRLSLGSCATIRPS